MIDQKQPVQEPPQSPLSGSDGSGQSPLRQYAEVAYEIVDDAELIRSLQSGCDKSFEVLFARYWKLVFAIAWKILRQRGEAEDVVQDVFLAIYLRSGKYDSTRGSVRTWIAQFAHFKALVRRRSIQASNLQNIDELNEFESGLMRFGTAGGVMERATFVEECLSTLNPRQRRAVELVHFDGYTLLEAAALLKESLANTRNLYYRGISALRMQLVAQRAGFERSEPAVSEDLSKAAAGSFIMGRTCRL